MKRTKSLFGFEVLELRVRGRGFLGGGSANSNSNEIDIIQFSDKTAINLSATLSIVRGNLTGVKSGGYL